MICKDCLHYDACKDIFLQLGEKEEAQYMDDNGVYGAEKECRQFKEKSHFIEIPCKVGDKLYYIVEDYDEEGSNSFVFETKVVSIGFDKDGFFMSIGLPLGKFQIGRLKIGVNIFKTYEEAEKKLEDKHGK